MDLGKTKTIAKNIDGTSKAFTFNDFEFRGCKGSRLGKYPQCEHIESVRITWRFQKNGNNGQSLTYAKNTLKPEACPVTAAFHIYQRAFRLRIHHYNPIVVFLTSRKTIRYIAHFMVEQTLKLLATKVYNITNKQELQKYTCHSLRVGACVLLHSSNASADTIKWRFRWKSDSYRMYLW